MSVRGLVISCGLGAVLLASNACDVVHGPTGAAGAFDRTLTVSGPVDLNVRTGSGHIQIRTGPGDTVHVIGRLRANASWFAERNESRIRQIEAHPPIEQSSGTIRIGETTDSPLYRNISISYELVVPADTSVRSHTGSGGQSIGSVRGSVEARTGSGSIQIEQVGSNVDASTGSGHIETERVDGSFTAHTGSGSIRAGAVGGAVQARTGSGSIDVTQTGEAEADLRAGSGNIAISGARGPLRAHTGSGSITLGGRPAQNWDVSAGSGTISLSLAENAAFNLDARTSSGAIQTSIPVTVSGVVSRRELHGTVRGGGASVRATTGSGAIRIR
jgi:DUF4097 and DUF4098 domain-containing protein YvlB